MSRSKVKFFASISGVIFLFSALYGFVIALSPVQTSSGNLNATSLHFISNNVLAIVYLLLGATIFGSTTFVGLVINGLYFGVTLKKSVVAGLTIRDVLILVTPHGIFEIPAIILAGAAGFKIPYEIIRYLLGRKERVLTKQDIKEYLILALVSIILIVIAAWIEANVTLKIAKAMLGTKGI